MVKVSNDTLLSDNIQLTYSAESNKLYLQAGIHRTAFA